MHEEKMRRLYQHVTVQGRHFYAVISQRLDHWVDFTGKQHEVARNSCFASACRLEVNSLSNSHRRWYLHVTVHDLVGAWNGELIDPAVYFSTLAHDLIDQLRINAKVLSWCSSGRRRKRSLAQGECIVDGLGDLRAITHRMNVHVHHAWRFMQHMVVQSRWFDVALFKFRHDWRYFIFGKHQITHRHRHIARFLESHPRAKSKRWFKFHGPDGDL